MNTATTNKLIIGCFCLCLVTMISSLYSIRTPSVNGTDKELNNIFGQVRDEIADLQKELIAIKKSLAEPLTVKRTDSKVEEQVTSLSPIVNETYNLVIENNDQLMGSTGKRSFLSKETSSLRQEVRKLAAKVDGIDLMLTKRASIDNMSAKLDRINIAFFGDGYTKGGGMSQKVDAMSRQGVKFDLLYDVIIGKGLTGEQYAYKESMDKESECVTRRLDSIQLTVDAIIIKLGMNYFDVKRLIKSKLDNGN